MSTIGYARVSTLDQNPDLQFDALRKAGVDRIFEDRVSGAKESRPGLDACLDYLRPGDALVVWRLDRLGRNTRHLLDLSELFRDRGIELVILTMGIDTRTPIGKFFYTIMGAFSEFERFSILERTEAGRAAARARGRVGGRPRKLTARQARLAREMYDEHGADGTRAHTVAEIAAQLGVARSTVYNYLAPSPAGLVAPTHEEQT